MSKRITEFINNNNLISEKQFGFRSSHSTIHAILSITDNIYNAIENGKFSCGLFLDLRKAFDSVNHSILIKKLNHYGFRGIVNDWFQNYLEDRKQLVSIGDIDSDLQIIRYGGSVLGPILFFLYINDLQNSSKILDFHLFADDANLFYASKSLQDLEHTMNNELINIQNWLNANKLALNADKSSFLIFHPPIKETSV